MLNVWTLKSGSSLGTIQERASFSQLLPILPLVGDLSGTTFSVISGALPPGLRILDDTILGTPFEVARVTDFKFVIRAKLGTDISDRTFTLTVQGPDDPVWITPSGDLGVNPNGQAFVLDNTYVDFNLSAIDQDIKAGDVLEFFIQDGDGVLPPGLTLTSTGKIAGRIDPILSLDISAGSGFFDTNQYDSNPFDFGLQPRTGMDSFLFDTVVYDYYDLVKAPRKLNRRYAFTVSASDGISIVKRDFTIYVVGDDFLRSDNTILQVGDGTFTADATYLRGAYWISASNLGVKRANNYVTVFLEAFDAIPEISPLVYELAGTNPDNTPSVLPDGLFLDANNGELFGFIPYQPAITREYQFTVNAIKYDATGFTEAVVDVVMGQNASYGQNYLMINPLTQQDVDVLVGEYLRIVNYQYKIVSYTSQTVMGGTYAMIKLDVPLKIDIPATDQQGAPTVFAKTFIQSTIQYNTNVSPKTFQLQVLGEVDSVIKYITPGDLGTIKTNFISTLSVVAQSSVPRAVLSYQLMTTNADGTASRLPTGLSLNAAGEIIGKVTQYGDSIVYRSYWKSSTDVTGGREYVIDDVVSYGDQLYRCVTVHTSGAAFDPTKWETYEFTNFGLTLFDLGQTPFDGGTQTYDRQFKFTILAIDQFKYSAILGEFTLNVKETSEKLYSNIYAQPYQKVDNRTYFGNFITDAGVFTPSKIYRLNDPGFGVQNTLKMLVYAGIETRTIGEYVPFLNRNIKRKRFKMGEIKRAIAKEQGSNDVLYEVVYIEVLDDYEVNKKSTDLKIKLSRNTNSKVLVNQARNSAAQGDLSTADNQAKLNKDEPDRFRPVKDPFTADNSAVFASGQDQEFAYPSSIINIRKNLRSLSVEDGSTTRAITIENEFLPLWMKTSQDSKTAATGFVNAIPLCYCKPGEGQYILDNVKNSGFDFGLIDYEIDRFIIDSTLGNSAAQVLKFTNYRYNV